MKYATLIAAAIGGLIIIGVVAWQINETTYHVSTPEEYVTEVQTYKDVKDVAHVVYPDDPQISGSLQIKNEHPVSFAQLISRLEVVPFHEIRHTHSFFPF